MLADEHGAGVHRFGGRHSAGSRTVKRAPSTSGGSPGLGRRPRAVLGDDRAAVRLDDLLA